MGEGKTAAAVAAGAAGGSLLGAFLAGKGAKAAPSGVDPAVWDALVAQTEAMALLLGRIDNLVSILGGGTGDEDDPFANTSRFTTGQVPCPVVGFGYQLPSIVIPKNKQLIVKALPGNVTWMYVGVTQADSQNLMVAYILVPNEGVGILIQNADRVWVSAQTVNDGIVYMVEQG